MLEGYLEFFIAGNLSLKNYVDAFSGEVMSDWVGYFGLIVPFLMPLTLLWIILRS